MTLKIEVTVPQDHVEARSGATYLENAMAAIGFSRGVSLPMPKATQHDDPVDTIKNTGPEPEETPAETPEPEGRMYGKPEEGKARRTKEQMAEDAEIEEICKRIGRDPEGLSEPASVVLPTLREVDTAKPNISTGDDERHDPANPEDRAQDAADEAAEVEATKGDALTLDDLRQAAGAFQKKHGMATAMEVIPELLGRGIHEVPEAEIGAAIEKLAAYEGASDPVEETPFTATKKDVIDAMLDYAEKFDGQREDTSAMPVMTEDRAKIFTAALGAGVDGLSKVPDEPEAYGKAVLAFREALEKNPFKREVK